MRLTLNVLRCPDAAVPESRTSNGNDIAIGRGLDCDWVLQDPDRVLSKRHCVLEFRGGYWQVRDTSTNGTFLNGAADPVGREMVAPLSDGDRLRFGNYEIEVRIAADAGAGWGAPAAAPPPAAAPWGEAAIGSSAGPGRPAVDPFADPLGPPGGGFGGGALPGGPGGLPADWDPLADMAPMPDHTPSASDAFVPPKPIPLPHASAIPPDWDPFGDSPPGAPAAPPAAPSGAPAAPLAAPPGALAAPPAASPGALAAPPADATSTGGLPADWDPLADLEAPAPTAPIARTAPALQVPAAPVTAAPAAPAPMPAAPIHPEAPPVVAGLPAEEIPPFALPDSEVARAPARFAAATAPVAAMPPPVAPPPEALGEDPFAEEGVPSRSIPHPDDLAAPGMPAEAGAALRAAMPVSPMPPPVAPPVVPPAAHGVAPVPPAAAHGLAPVAPAAAHGAPPAAAMPAAAGDLGAAVAALLRGAGVAPGALHGAAAENPLAVFEQAGAALRAAVAGIRALLIARADVKREFRIEQTMLRAAGNNPLKFAATDDMAVAALIAGQGTRAVSETVNDLTAHEVATLAATQAAARALLGRLAPEVVEENDAGGGGLFGSREKRLWEAYRKLHTKVTEQFEDDFDSAFGKEFARAYEQAVAAKDD